MLDGPVVLPSCLSATGLTVTFTAEMVNAECQWDIKNIPTEIFSCRYTHKHTHTLSSSVLSAKSVFFDEPLNIDGEFRHRSSLDSQLCIPCV